MEKTKDMLLIEKLRRVSRSIYGRRPDEGPGMLLPPLPHGMMPPPFGPLPMPHSPGAHPKFGCHPGRPGPFSRERVLAVVLESGDEGVRQKDIAEKLGINAPALTEQIDRLEAERYLERCVNPNDKRSTLVKLTEKGRARAYEVMDERQEHAAAFCAALSEEEKDTLLALLDKLLVAAE